MTERRLETIVIAGGTGQVGRILSRAFLAEGFEVIVLSRSPVQSLAGPGKLRMVEWDGRSLGPWWRELEGAMALINLAGRSVNCRYTPTHRQEILESRVQSTAVLGMALSQCSNPPAVWLNASTATIYRHSLDRDMDDMNGEWGGDEPGVPPSWKFSTDVARAWEETFFGAPVPDTIRRVALRSAMTMSPDPGGVFDVLYGLTRLGLGGTNGSGAQYVSWIHEQDFVRAVRWILDRNALAGAVNICSPNPLPNREFMAILRRAAGRPWGLPAQWWMLEIGAWWMKTETELVLKSRRVVPKRLLDTGFRFNYPEWTEAAKSLCHAKLSFMNE